MKQFLLLFLIVFLAGCMGSDQTSKGDTTTTINPTTTIPSTSGKWQGNIFDEYKDGEFVDIPNEILPCENRTNLTDKDICFYTQAVSGKIRSDCESIQKDSLASRCRAEIDGDSVKCERIGDVEQHDWCFRNLAFKKSNIELCIEITSTKIRDECLSNYLKYKKPDPYMCFKIKSTELKDECIYDHVKQELINGKLCYMIDNPEWELECNQTYIEEPICSARIT